MKTYFHKHPILLDVKSGCVIIGGANHIHIELKIEQARQLQTWFDSHQNLGLFSTHAESSAGRLVLNNEADDVISAVNTLFNDLDITKLIVPPDNYWEAIEARLLQAGISSVRWMLDVNGEQHQHLFFFNGTLETTLLDPLIYSEYPVVVIDQGIDRIYVTRRMNATPISTFKTMLDSRRTDISCHYDSDYHVNIFRYILGIGGVR